MKTLEIYQVSENAIVREKALSVSVLNVQKGKPKILNDSRLG